MCKVLLEWEYVDDAKLYHAYRNVISDTSSAIKIGESVTNSFWDNNANRNYFYWVIAANEYTSSDYPQNLIVGSPEICSYNTSTPEIIFDHEGGSYSFNVTPSFNSPECSWRISSSDDWINNISPLFGTGEQTITFTIAPNNIPLTGTIDIDGDNSFCNSTHSSVQVINNRFIISGNVMYFNSDTPIEGVKLTLEGDLNPQDVYTDENGAYAFPPSPNGNYHVTPSYTAPIPEMVITPFDASLIFRNIKNIISFDNYQQLAADIDDDGDADIIDVVLILGYSLGQTDRFKRNTWLFAPITKNYSLDQDTSEHYKGIVLGDTSGNWNPQGEIDTSVITDPAFIIELPDITDVSTNDQIQIPISITPTTGADIYSYYAVITYNPEMLTCTAVTKEMNDWIGPSVNTNPAGKIRIAALGLFPLDIDGVLLQLHFTIIGESNDSSPLTFETFLFNEGTPSVTTKDGSVSIVEKNRYILDLDIIGNGQVLVNDTFETLPWKGVFTENETIQLEATPLESFYQWMGDITNNHNSISIVMNRNKQIKAVFNRFDFILKKGWNLVSLPVIPVDNQLSSIFPDADIAYEFQQGGYRMVDRLIPGKGYWVKIPTDKTYPIGGLPFNSFITEYHTGWNLIGVTDQVSTPEDHSLTDITAIYEYCEGAYDIPYQFEPGKGYWLKKQ
ncbi:MAG: hypothetical protein OMM_04582 [Candidatus Magnetoglobus multicellularis str. Araruama]|uniref:Cohesin domain-containing protein n=1 Tax=Candidatus Magnetoglobus multicellularis str. Araruama TaxID=890399 RepID=A0A1V1P0M7_9BACT|nr:MAG: hypothetical protein OMM_04582 [Candidatus Magnetoglobus multicellularis str. Araruama]